MLEPISEIIDEKENGIRPIIVQFQNSELQEGKEKNLRSQVYKKSKNSILVTAATKDILYTGKISQNKEQDDPYRRFLLVSNRKTGKVRAVAVDTVILAPYFKKHVNDELDSQAQLNVSSINNLNKQFGSKKIKRITEQKERLKMNVEAIKEQLEKTVADIEVPETESFSTQVNENESLYRPPINRDASTKEQVYILNDLVPQSVLDSLTEEANHLLSSELDNSELNPFILKHISNIQSSSVQNKLEKCKVLLYLHYLMAYILKPAKNITKKLVICPSSKEVNNHILDNFSVTSNTGRTRPISLRDKTICYILVLCMIALDYELNMEDLSKHIKLGVKKLQDMGRILAFSPLGKNKNYMVLKVPLPPAVSISPKKRKR